MKLKTVRSICDLLIGLLILLMLLLLLTRRGLFGGLAILDLIVFGFFYILFWRCPNCGKPIAGMRKYVGSDEEAAALISAPYVLKRGKAISGHKNHKGNRYPSVTYAAPVTINGDRVNVGVVVLFGDKNRPHSLRVLMPSGKEYVLKK